MGLTSTVKTAYSTVSLTTTCDSWFEFVLVGLSPFPQVILAWAWKKETNALPFCLCTDINLVLSPLSNSSPLPFILQGYYKRTPDYLPIYNRERVGCFQVPVVHSTMLIDLRSQRSDASHRLTYWPAPEGFKGPVDDVVQFAFSAKKEGEL